MEKNFSKPNMNSSEEKAETYVNETAEKAKIPQPLKKEQATEDHEKNQNTALEKDKNSILSVFSKLDVDMSLILPLILFLGKEGADEMLILALIYIMS